ncbi:aldehyde oxidoreductase [Halarchaeum grantii]|uniref:Aldehyde oxidoreductase n=1 Tax=Halarchaeum grantii TaxID=1193105 RepID=A0A830FBW5_9EURY|nr:aldo/keto reductase [Halarchaeum grantii]GGL39258.1 aldehyde oxidoreductase [Halarchaeum grantii]
MPIEMPRLGLGTYTDDDQEGRYDAVKTALDVGYRHIDTAQVYENEEYVGAAIADSDVAREDVFLATKTVHHDVPESPGDVRDAIEGCLERLGTNYVDLLYVHWPTGVYDAEAVLGAYQDAHDDGLVEHIGVSNFLPEHLEEAREVLDVPIAAHQFEMHPLLPQDELRADAREHGYWAVAYSPVAQGRVADLDPVVEAADAHDASPYQVALAWLLSKENVAAVPRATGRAHIADNYGARDLELTASEVAAIDAIEDRERLIDPEWAPWN